MRFYEIKRIGADFKYVRYPTRQEKDDARKRFQSIVASIKEIQQYQREQREANSERSAQFRDEIMSQAESGRPMTAFEESIVDMILAVPRLIADSVMDLMGLKAEIDERKEELQVCSNNLRDAWNCFNDFKFEMLGRDRHETFERLKEIQEQLYAAWDAWKELNGQYHQARHADRRERVEANIERLETRLENLNGILAKKEEHLSELEEKRDSAWSDDFREVVGGRIDKEEADIDDIKSQISQVEEWLDGARGRL